MDGTGDEAAREAADLEVFAREASSALARQEDRLNDQRKRALEGVGVASIVFGLFGAFRGDHGITWAIVVALGVFGFLVAVGVCLQFSGREPWYFVQDVTALKQTRAETIAAGEPWNVHGHLATELEASYLKNRPRIDYRGSWLAVAFASLGLIVVFLTVDLLITNTDGSTHEQPAVTTVAAAAGADDDAP